MDVSRFKFTQRAAGRFFENSDSDFDVSLNENKNTKRKTETDMRIFSSYLVSINESREPEAIPADELDRHLATYFSVIKKHDGNEYEPASLRGMLCSIERHLRSKNYPISLTRDYEFTSTRNMLKERQKLLRELSKTEKGTKSNIIALSTAQRLNQLYLAKEFGPHNPSAVINALCFAFVVHLKIRKAIDHKQLLWGDIVLKISPSNEEYLCYEPLSGYEYCRLPLKGISGYRVLGQSPETSLWDPISIYKLYRLKRPTNMMTPESPFYLGIATQIHDSQQHQSWFKPIAMGVNKLNDLVRMIRDITGTLCQSPSYQYDVYEATDRARDASEADDDMRSSHESESSASLNKAQNSADDNEMTLQDSDDKVLECDRSVRARSDEVKCKTSIDGDENDDDGSLFDTEVLEDAKKKIQSVLDDLVPKTRSEIMKWLKNIVYSSGHGGSECRQKDSRKRILLTFELDNAELEKCGTVEKKAKLEVSAGFEEDNKKHEKEQLITSRSPDEDSADVQVLYKSSEKETAQSSLLDQSDRLHRLRQTFFKRALSYPNDLKDAKIPKIQEKSQFDDSCTLQHDSKDYVEAAAAERQTNVTTTSVNTADTSTPEYNSDTSSPDHSSKINPPDTIHHVQGYNPYTAWALDPRFAMFMRNGFMQTYQDFVSLYSHQEHKDA